MTPTEKYVACTERMLDAAVDWLQACGTTGAVLAFADIETPLKKRAGIPVNEPVALAIDLAAVIDVWGANDSARALLQAMEKASEREATYMQARAVLETLRDNGWCGPITLH